MNSASFSRAFNVLAERQASMPILPGIGRGVDVIFPSRLLTIPLLTAMGVPQPKLFPYISNLGEPPVTNVYCDADKFDIFFTVGFSTHPFQCLRIAAPSNDVTNLFNSKAPNSNPPTYSSSMHLNSCISRHSRVSKEGFRCRWI